MNKLSYILLTLIFSLVTAIGVTWYVQYQSKTSSAVPTYTDLTVSLPSSSGEKVVVNNFLKDPKVVEDTQNKGLYFLGNTFVASNPGVATPRYVVTYQKESGYFNIVLLQKPFSTSRLAAEVYIKNLLHVDETELCELSYAVTVPGYVDEEASGINYHFSFCSNAANLR